MGYLYLLLFEFCGLVIADRLLSRYARSVRIYMGLSLGFMMLMWFPSLFAFFMRFSA